MMIPLLIVHDVTVLPDGNLALGGTDEYLDPAFLFRADYFDGGALLLILRGGKRIETVVSETRVHKALSEQRNIYLKIPNITNEIGSMRGAIACMDWDQPGRSEKGPATRIL
jgi:hypothetical protein